LPKIRFSDLPRGLWQHLLERVDQRRIPLADLRRPQARVKAEPHGPEGDSYKDFGFFKLCGSGEYPKTFPIKGMKPYGVRRVAELTVG
jgi:hypothetical protein